MADPAQSQSTASIEERMRVRAAVEPTIPAPTSYSTVEQVSAVISGLYSGQIGRAAQLTEQMWQNSRLRAAFSTRLMGLTGAEVRWHPSQENRDGRRAAKAAAEDEKKVMSTASRKQLHKWGLLPGVGFAQKAWYLDVTGRAIPRVQVFHPGSIRWRDDHYEVRTADNDVIDLESPALVPFPERQGEWVIHEPFGSYSWRDGYVVSAWYPWLANNLARRDSLRTGEKLGRGITLVDIPHGASKVAAQELVTGIRAMGPGSVIPLEQMADTGASFNLRPLEWSSANGFQLLDSIFASSAVDLVILALGHNQTTEVKSGGSYASATVGNDVRSDYVEDDAESEWSTLYWQVWRDWAEVNFGDPNVAPRREVVSDPPSRDKDAATMTSLVAQSLDNLARHGADIPALLDMYRIPSTVVSKTVASVPAMVERANADETQPDATDSAEVEASDVDPTSTSEEKQVETVDAKATLQLTATDLASVVKVDEARGSIGLEAEGGEVGARWVVEHSAIVRSTAPMVPTQPAPAPASDPNA